MTVDELSNEFDSLVASYVTKDSPVLEFDEYEKSMFLTKAQRDVIVGLYNGTLLGKSYEQDEEIRSYLLHSQAAKIYIRELNESDFLLKNDELPDDTNNGSFLYFLGYKYCEMIILPKECMFVLNEFALVQNDENYGITDVCNTDNPIGTNTVPVVPVRKDELVKTIKNPFKRPTKDRVLRTDNGPLFNGEAILDDEDAYFTYWSAVPLCGIVMTYLAYPGPIILTDLDNVTIEGQKEKTDDTSLLLSNHVYDMILRKAVQDAVNSRIKTTKSA